MCQLHVPPDLTSWNPLFSPHAMKKILANIGHMLLTMLTLKKTQTRVKHVICSFLGNSPASEF